LASFFGTDGMSTPFYLTSGRFPGEQRFFSRFSDVTNEIVEARIWAGIHFRNADVQAANLGRNRRTVHPRDPVPLRALSTQRMERPSGRSMLLFSAAVPARRGRLGRRCSTGRAEASVI
jgi:hypothetical protein